MLTMASNEELAATLDMEMADLKSMRRACNTLLSSVPQLSPGWLDLNLNARHE